MDNTEQDPNSIAAQEVVKTGFAATTGLAAAATAQLAAGALVPSAMATFGTIVPGVGTIHAAGGVAATLQAFSATSLLGPVGLVGIAAGAAGYGIYKLVESQQTQSPEPASKE